MEGIGAVEMEYLQYRGRTQIWAHRGASAYAPENTMEAFQMAIDMGADGIELDVQFTKDQQMVVVHDRNLERVSNVSGFVQQYTLEELKTFRFNNKKPDFPEARISTLEEVYDLVRPTNLILNVELKTVRNQNYGIEIPIAQLTRDMGMESKVVFSSFNHNSIMRLKKLLSNARFAFLQNEELADAAEYAKSHGMHYLHPDKFLIQDENYLRQCQEAGIGVHPFTINDIDELWDCYDKNVDAVITNEPFKAVMLEKVWRLLKDSKECIYIWGTGTEAGKLSNCIPEKRIAGYIETVVTREKYRGKNIYSPVQIEDLHSKIIVATVFSDEIRKVSRNLQLKQERMIYLFPFTKEKGRR